MNISRFFDRSHWRKLALAASALALLPFATFADTARIEPGHSAAWIDPARGGEGWVVEVMPDDTAALYWFTSDDAGNPRWLISHAPIIHGEDGDKVVYSVLLAGHGGRFGPNYSTDDVILENVGTAELSFSDCDNGRISFDAYGKARSYPMIRLSRTMGAGCGPLHGVPGQPVQPYAGTSRSWFDPDKAGQVFTLQWQADGSAFLFWFTYDPAGNPFWISGTGRQEEGRLVFGELISVRGGRFGEDYPPDQPEMLPWGRMELELTCDSGTALYEATAAGFGSGSFNLLPMTGLAKPACPWVTPKLTDLYDLEWTELPVPPDAVEFEIAPSIANDGTVIALKRLSSAQGYATQVLRFPPGASEWEAVSPLNLLANTLNPTLISPDASKIYAQREVFAAGMPLATSIEVWGDVPGWMPLPNTLESNWQHLAGQSSDGQWLVGTGREADSTFGFAWKWSAGTGQVKLPATEQMRINAPLGISNDGARIVGESNQMVEEIPGEGEIEIGTPPPPSPMPVAIEWIDGQPPGWVLTPGQTGPFPSSEIFDCDADCRLIMGTGRPSVEAVPPEGFTEAWYRMPNGGFVHIEKPVMELDEPDVQRLVSNIHVAGGEATIAAGYYAILEGGVLIIESDGWLWTQNTGLVDLHTVLEDEYGFSQGWESRFAAAISKDGRALLVGDGNRDGKHAVLRLIPKAAH